MIGDTAKEVLAMGFRHNSLLNHKILLINVNQEPLEDYDTPWNNPDVLGARLTFMFAWRQSVRSKNKAEKPFLLTSDAFLQTTMRFKSYEHLVEVSHRVTVDGPEEVVERFQIEQKLLRFLLRWSNLTPEMFALAERNKEVFLPVYVDIVGYAKYLDEKIKERDGEAGLEKPNLTTQILSNAERLRYEDYMFRRGKRMRIKE